MKVKLSITALRALALIWLVAVTFLSGCGVGGGGSKKSDCSAQPEDPKDPFSDGVEVYFGCGCFWHVQHEFVSCVEQGMRMRPPDKLSSFTGYAGSTRTGEDGLVCYSDYGSMGHGEVVSLRLSPNVAGRVFEFFLTSVCPRGRRADPQDTGPEYRTLVGFPGGIDSDLGKLFASVAEIHGVSVAAGAGSDDDKPGMVWVMDTQRFPFHQAELYHQFHDDMVERYDGEYKNLKQQCRINSLIHDTACPDQGGLWRFSAV